MLFPVCSSVFYHQRCGGSTSLLWVNALQFFPRKWGKIPRNGFWNLKGGYLNNIVTPTNTLGKDRASHKGAPILSTCTTLVPPSGERDYYPNDFLPLMDSSDILLSDAKEIILGQGSRTEQEMYPTVTKVNFCPVGAPPIACAIYIPG